MNNTEQTIVPGTLVRYDETTNRWFIAVAKKARPDSIELAYLSGAREWVDSEKVTPFRDSLKDRQKVLSLIREDLCYCMFAEERTRLTADRINKMQKCLRNHGLRYSPDGDWPSGCRVRIDYDGSYVSGKPVKTDKTFLSLLPQWLAPHVLPPGARDPLGFQGYAEKIANELLPGLTVFTSRIGYYGLIAWAINRLNNGNHSSDTKCRDDYHRIERALALCEFIFHDNENDFCRLLGQRSRSEVLQSGASNNRYSVPDRILRNQESTGSLRLYTTSMVSNGFAVYAPELAAINQLPFILTETGQRLGDAFGKRLPEGFLEFVLSDKTKDKEDLRKWGKQLCLYSLGSVQRYKDLFLAGFIWGNSKEAEIRYQTVRLLFNRKMLGGDYTLTARDAHEAFNEVDSSDAEEIAGIEGLNNADVLMAFYEEKPTAENRQMQKAAVFELLSISLVTIFAHAMHALEENGRADLNGLCTGIVQAIRYGSLWQIPCLQAGRKAPTVRKLEHELFESDSPVMRAAIGGCLICKLKADAILHTVAPDIADSPVIALLEKISSEKPLADSYVDLMNFMVERHQSVSIGKNRQRWCYLEGTSIVKDDLRPLATGWHSMRFPQLYSICRDLRLQEENLSHG